MPYFMANDGCKLHYDLHGESGPPLILIHGWSGSRRYFDLNVDDLAKTCRVYAVDLRFHGASDKPSHGFHVHRLAADLNDLLTHLQLTTKPVVLGSSLGCAVIWAYVELYGDEALGKCIFVDQAPSQWALPDWTLGSKGIYDAASLANIQAALGDMSAFADGNAECCLSIPPSAGSGNPAHGAANDALRAWADAQGASKVLFVDSSSLVPFARSSPLWMMDGLHMTAAGYEQFGTRLADAIAGFVAPGSGS